MGWDLATIFDILLHETTADVHVWSLPNARGGGEERWIGTRRLSRIESFVQKRDVPGRATYYCVGTIEPGKPRKKEHAVELPFLHTDIDFKDVLLGEDGVFHVLRHGIALPPSRIHHTGHGFHCIWLLDKPVLADGMQAAEALLRMLANYLGADRQVAHRVALLRVPGTHNTKRDGESIQVGVWKDGSERYTLGQIRDWLAQQTEPAIKRKNQETNPFLLIADDQEIHAPIDVRQLLADMDHGNIHDTQLRCTASMAAMGIDEEAAVALVLEATKRLRGTEGWNWVFEEHDIREMFRDAVSKFGGRDSPAPRGPDNPRAPATDGSSALNTRIEHPPKPTPDPDNVIHLHDARGGKPKEPKDKEKQDPELEAKKEEALGKISKKLKNEHVVIGKRVLMVLDHQEKILMYAHDQAHMNEGGIWTAMSAEQEKSWASIMVEQACTAARIVSNTKIVNEVRAWLQRQPELNKAGVVWDAHGQIACRTGLLDHRSGAITHRPILPADYATRRIECEYDPAAQCPHWEEMLREDYRLEQGAIDFLQEWAGTSFLYRRARTLRRALVIQGPSNAAKSTVINVLAGLHNHEHNTTPIPQVEGTHGLMPFLRPVPWVLHEAFDQSRWEVSATVKALLSGDGVHVNVKNGPMVTLEFLQPIIWGTNVPPQFRESSRAMENRLAILRMQRVFDPMEPVGTAVLAQERGYNGPADMILAEELPGIFNWAVRGLQRVWQRGRFLFTDEIARDLHAMRTDGNMAIGFIEECCAWSPDHYVTAADFYAAFTVWHHDHRGGQTPSIDSLGRAMAALADERVVSHRISHKRTYAGLMLREEGLDCWNAYAASARAEGSGQRISGTAADVCKVLGADALMTEAIQAMRRAHEV